MPDQSTATKTCSKCGQVAAASLFPTDRNTCKGCVNARQRAAYSAMPAESREELLGRNRAWRAANAEDVRAQKREHRRLNKKQASVQQKAWREANADHLAASKRAYHLANVDALRAKARAWKKANRPLACAANSRRRARLKDAPGWNYTTAQHIAWRWQMWGGRCWVCGEKAEATDHVLPVGDGGPHWPANLRPICKSCNSSRKKKRQR